MFGKGKLHRLFSLRRRGREMRMGVEVKWSYGVKKN